MSPPRATAVPAAGHAAAVHRAGRHWADRLRDWRDRLVTRAEFRQWAARFPLTRPIARRRAAQLFDLVAGFTYSQVLLACVRLRVFDRLAERLAQPDPQPATLAELSAQLGLAIEPCRRLLDAAVALQLLERHGPAAAEDPLSCHYRLGPLGAPMVGNTAIAAMVEHHTLLYADLADPVAMLRAAPGQGELARYWAYARHPQSAGLAAAQVADYSALMAASQPLVADEILDAYSLASHRCLLDVGGGEGVFAAAAARRWPHLQLQVFDLPAVAQRAHGRLAALGLADRASAHGGDFTIGPLPSGADIISLVRVVHDHDDAKVLALLRQVRAALPDDGVLLLAEPMADTQGAQAMGDAYFGLYLWAMGSGRPRSPQALAALLHEAGFAPPRALRTAMPLQTRVLLARPRR